MKLSQLFSEVHVLWTTTTLFQLGVWMVFVSAVAYASHRLAERQYSSAKVFLVFSVAVVLVIGAMESSMSVAGLLTNPMTLALIAATTGVGVNVQRRLVERG